MNTFDFYLNVLFNLNFFKVNVLTFDSILNDLISGSTPLYKILSFYRIAFNLFIFLKLWHKLIFIDLKFNIIFSKYANFYKVYKLKINSIIESFIIIDFYYTNKGGSFAGDMNTGFFTNCVFLQQYKVMYKKLLFITLCQQYTYDSFYKNFVQYLQSTKVNFSLLHIPDFFLIFSSENKMPTSAFEFLNLNLIGLGVFDLGVSAFRLKQLMYSFVCGALSFFCFVFLLKLFFFDYICAYFERIKIMIKKCKVPKHLYTLCDLNFNLISLTAFSSIHKTARFSFIYSDLLLLVYLRKRLCLDIPKSAGVGVCCSFYAFLYIYIYLNLLRRF